jgi:hypothetical protein
VSEKAARRFTEKAIEKGFDGVEAESGFGVHKLQWYVAFDAKQIKSATDNSGEFSGETSDIRFRKGNGKVSDEEVSRKSPNGEGYLYDRFGRGWIESAEKEYIGKKLSFDMLNKKCEEIFGSLCIHPRENYPLCRDALFTNPNLE